LGILDRLRGRSTDKPNRTGAFEAREMMLRGGARVHTVGESYYQDALGTICGGKSAEGHQHTCIAVLIHEPNNPHDRNAVGVYIDGRKVGHLSRAEAVAYQPVLARLAATNSVGCCHALIVGGWDRGDGDEGHFGVQLDLAPPAFAHPHDPTPPRAPESTTRPRRDSPGIWTGSSTSDRSSVGKVEGRHYTEWVDTVKGMKRLGHHEQALQLLYRLCDAAEAESEQARQTLPPWYFEQVAIIERKQGNFEAEVAILQRYGTSTWAVPAHFDERLEKARAKVGRHATRSRPPHNAGSA
jgi:hypothetical protein